MIPISQFMSAAAILLQVGQKGRGALSLGLLIPILFLIPIWIFLYFRVGLLASAAGTFCVQILDHYPIAKVLV